MKPEYDLVIRDGMIVDGTGAPGFKGDVAVAGGKVAAVGRLSGLGAEEIDAKGLIVTPGFVDIHTHYDGQATWENRLSPSSNHGVTTVVTGNCGVGFAPCRPGDHDRLIRLMEGVEDIPEVVMAEGLPWNWESFPDYLNALSRRRFDVDIAAQIPHSPLRVYVMGERGAQREPSTQAERTQMAALVRDAIRAGAIGVSTSRSLNHRSKDGSLAPSIDTARIELLALAEGLRQAESGVFQMITDSDQTPAHEFAIMREIAETAARPLSFTLLQSPYKPDQWREFLELLDRANDDGVTMRGQVFPRPVGTLYGLDLSFHPLCLRPLWHEIVKHPLAEKVAALSDPDFRGRILSEADRPHPLPMVNALLAFTGNMVPFREPSNYFPSAEQTIAAIAARRGVDLHECALDLMLEDDGKRTLYLPSANFHGGSLAAARAMMDSPHTVLGLGDGGAHYGLICDASFPTTMLSYWARDAAPGDVMPIEAAVHALSAQPATSVGLCDRGLLAPGRIADINLIDHARLSLHVPRARYDLPGGGRRLTQEATGYTATIKSGVVTYREGEATGALPGMLVRGSRAA